ncbi:MAG: hypothetical protein UY81_C0021G0009 [Candidatus Giovannonibacteria bacterium GW2011_GWA2_53_7]|uniref:Uncharacterized protein n=1 Tax=Candidatus Giovannonibacteria bacterium GW2011_GWA2_53_7 TaxID=1618650 RepID=A0A0G1Y041_9BACT|nr:MAG: hypothetical protein UY81_C0021G0009 [Candidatus Giovannonibacteria bacterium GW2011_GWA2_53_7]
MTHAIEPRDAAFALVLHRFLARFAHTAVSAFVWIILFLYFADIEPSLIHAVIRTFLLYALAQTVTILAAPFASSAYCSVSTARFIALRMSSNTALSRLKASLSSR